MAFNWNNPFTNSSYGQNTWTGGSQNGGMPNNGSFDPNAMNFGQQGYGQPSQGQSLPPWMQGYGAPSGYGQPQMPPWMSPQGGPPSNYPTMTSLTGWTPGANGSGSASSGGGFFSGAFGQNSQQMGNMGGNQFAPNMPRQDYSTMPYMLPQGGQNVAPAQGVSQVGANSPVSQSEVNNGVFQSAGMTPDKLPDITRRLLYGY